MLCENLKSYTFWTEGDLVRDMSMEFLVYETFPGPCLDFLTCTILDYNNIAALPLPRIWCYSPQITCLSADQLRILRPVKL